MKKILWLLILFTPFIYSMEERKRKSSDISSEKETLDQEQFINKKQKTPNEIVQVDEDLKSAVYFNSVDQVKELLEAGANPDINMDLEGLKPKPLLVFAIEKGFNEIAQLLIHCGTLCEPINLLLAAITDKNSQYVRQLLTHQNLELNVNIIYHEKLITLVEYACLQGDLEIVECLINSGAPCPEYLFNQSITSLPDETEKDRELNSNSIQLNNSGDEFSETDHLPPIPQSKQAQDCIIMKLINDKKYLQAKKIIDEIGRLPDPVEKKLKQEICSEYPDSIEVMRELLCLSTKFNYVVLINTWCVSFNDTSIVKFKYLLNHIDNLPSLEKAIKLVEDAREIYKAQINKWLVEGVRSNRKKLVKKMLKAGGNPNTIFEYYRKKITLLSLAKKREFKEVEKLLDKHGASDSEINIDQNSSNKSPKPEKPLDLKSFIDALKTCDVDAIKFLANETNVNQTDEKGFNGLIYGVISNSLEMVMLFLSYGANINQPDLQGNTPLFWAIETNNEEMVKFLIANGASINQ